VGTGQDQQSKLVTRDVASRQLRQALHELKSASAIISATIDDELAGSKDRGILERLYWVNDHLRYAIEETQKRLPIEGYQ